MPTIEVEEKGCRYCSLCHDVCPTQVFDLDAAASLARAARQADCIGCLSCEYICPSRCLRVTDVARQLPYHRIEEDASIVAKFLQREPVTFSLTEAEMEEALVDVGIRLSALGASVTETMGRGQKAVGRKAGQLAAAHLPEMYEGRTVQEVLDRLQRRFRGSFDFAVEATADGTAIDLRFDHCALGRVVRSQGAEEGQAVLCILFHEYWAGLLGQFTSRTYALEPGGGTDVCSMKLRARN